MEAKNLKGNSESKGKKRAKMSRGGDIGGLVVLGGALAVAGFFATFVIKRHKRKGHSNGKRSQKSNKYMPKKDQEDYGNQGLRCLLRPPLTTASSSYRGNGDSSTMSVFIQEDSLLTEIDDGPETQMMVTPEYSDREIVVLSDNFCAVRDKDGTMDEIPIESDDEVGEEVHLVEEEREEEDEVYVEKNEKSSMDFLNNAVWPAETIEDTMPEVQTNDSQRSVVQEVKTVVADNRTHFNGDIVFNNHPVEKSMIVNEESEQSSKVRVWILSMLIVAVLFLSLAPVYRRDVSVVLP